MRISNLVIRTALMLLVISIVPLLFVGFIEMEIVRGALEKDFEVVRTRLAERTGKSAAEFIKGVTGLLTTIGELDELSQFKKTEYSSIVHRILQSHPMIAELDIYDGQGKWLFGMERTPGSVPAQAREDQLMSYIQDTVRQFGRFQGNILRVGGYPAVELFLPIRRQQDRQVAGYLRAIVSLLALSESLADIKIGKSSELFIVDTKGRLIAHSGYKKIFAADSKVALDPVLVERAGKMSSAYQVWTGRLDLLDKRDVIAGLYLLDDQPWVAGSLQERWEAFVVMVEMRQKLVEVFLVVIIVVVLASFLFAGRIIQPVRSLTRAVRQVVAADFARPPTEPLPKPNNEIGELSRAFETMTKVLANRTQELFRVQDELKFFNTELEARVEARTKELRATQDEMIKQERLAAIGQMASVVGHELRNPLSVINNSIYVIKTRRSAGDAAAASPGAPPVPAPGAPVASKPDGAERASGIDPKVIRHVVIIEGELQIANQIISEILTFARTREIQLRDMELHGFLEEVVGRLQLPEKVVIAKRYAAGPIPIRADPDELRQVVRNLISNAFDAMPNGGGVTVSTSINKNYAVMTIADTGMGIAPEVVAKIFTPFFTTKSKGTGLGLSVVKKVMDRHNGEVTAESTLGKGTTFTLKLPLTRG